MLLAEVAIKLIEETIDSRRAKVKNVSKSSE